MTVNLLDRNTGKPYRLCKGCGQPLLPRGVRKRPGHYDHATGCSFDRRTQRKRARP